MKNRPDLNGQRVTSPANGAIYLIDEGCKRHVHSPAAMENLFCDWTTIIDEAVDGLDEGSRIDDQIVLAKGLGQTDIFLIDRTKSGKVIKRYIRSPEAMAKYNFAWNKVHQVPPALLDNVKEGPEIG